MVRPSAPTVNGPSGTAAPPGRVTTLTTRRLVANTTNGTWASARVRTGTRPSVSSAATVSTQPVAGVTGSVTSSAAVETTSTVASLTVGFHRSRAVGR